MTFSNVRFGPGEGLLDMSLDIVELMVRMLNRMTETEPFVRTKSDESKMDSSSNHKPTKSDSPINLTDPRSLV